MTTEHRCTVCGRALSATASTARGMGTTCEKHAGCCLSPFVIAVDSNEGKPYRFLEIKEDVSRGGSIIIPRIKTWAMWTIGLADYSIEGLETEIQIERKTKQDLYSTLAGRRESFEQEIKRLDKTCQISYIVIESEWSEILSDPPARSRLNPKTISRTADSWSMKYPSVHWITCPGRRFAEIKTYRLLEMFWRQKHAAVK